MNRSADLHALLPWYVTETLEAAGRDRFAAHLLTCTDCRP